MQHYPNPGPDDFWFIPLGGTGEIGMNLNLYGHNDRWLMIDCGISFFDQLDKNGFTQTRVIMPDISFARSIKDKIVGLVITHAHEDHIGAIPYLWPELGCPIYATRFTRNVLLNKLARANCPAPVDEIPLGESLQLGDFHLDPVAMTHSTLETQGFVISTPAARIFHTADWKLDPDPVIGIPASKDLYENLGALDAVVSDSTNVLEPTSAVSEAKVYEGLLAVIEDAPARVVVSCFASNVARLQTLGKIAKQTHRYLGLLGHSLDVMFDAAKQAGYLSDDFTVYNSSELAYLPPEEVLIIATGSQGQAGSALHKLAMDNHRDLNLSPDDQVILSSKTIPGNEQSIDLMLKLFNKLNVKVWQADNNNLALHASGHGGRPEIQQLFEWTRPATVVPVHGEPKHLESSAALARQIGISNQLVGSNVDLFDIVHASITKKAVPSGVLALDSYGQLLSFQTPT